METALYIYIYKAKHMGVKNVTKPVCGAGDVLLKVNVCTICGTDGENFFKKSKNPFHSGKNVNLHSL